MTRRSPKGSEVKMTIEIQPMILSVFFSWRLCEYPVPEAKRSHIQITQQKKKRLDRWTRPGSQAAIPSKTLIL